jgi:hypothetical protein
MTKYTAETNEIKAIRRGMSLMPRWHALPDTRKLWDDLLVKSGVGEWVQYADVKAHYDVVISIIQRAQKRADEAEERAKVTLERFAMVQRENTEYKDLCESQARTLTTLRMKL